MIELHCHTTASDGTLSPSELVRHAHRLGVTHLAITDHDTVAGVRLAQPLCAERSIHLIPAVELSTRDDGVSLDILGYGIDVDADPLTRALDAVVAARNERAPKMVARLREAGFSVTMDDVLDAAAGGVVGRPHIARALVDRGVVANVKEAFRTLLGEGCVGYVPKEVLTPDQAVSVIRSAGGLAVLAHPCYVGHAPLRFLHMLDRLTAAGLEGLEVYYSQHTEEDVARYAAAARERQLLATGGSDFHGENKPHIALGSGPGGRPLPASLAEVLLARLALR